MKIISGPERKGIPTFEEPVSEKPQIQCTFYLLYSPTKVEKRTPMIFLLIQIVLWIVIVDKE